MARFNALCGPRRSLRTPELAKTVYTIAYAADHVPTNPKTLPAGALLPVSSCAPPLASPTRPVRVAALQQWVLPLASFGEGGGDCVPFPHTGLQPRSLVASTRHAATPTKHQRAAGKWMRGGVVAWHGPSCCATHSLCFQHYCASTHHRPKWVLPSHTPRRTASSAVHGL
jgi:hypothetical protein